MSSVTPAIRFLRERGIAFTEHPYQYEHKGGTFISSRELGVSEHLVVKTLVMEDEDAQPLLILMHGDRKVSTRRLARQIGRRSIEPCTPTVAQKHTGYMVGGTSPFGTRKPLPVFIERSILDLHSIYVNGGRRGLLVAVSPADMAHVLDAVLVEVAIAPGQQEAE